MKKRGRAHRRRQRQDTNPHNPVEIKTPSGITIYKTHDLGRAPQFDWYHPGEQHEDGSSSSAARQELTTYTGSGPQGSRTWHISFRQTGEAFPLPGFNGAKTVVTITSVKRADGSTTYTVTTDYPSRSTRSPASTTSPRGRRHDPGQHGRRRSTTPTPRSRATVLKPDYQQNLVDRYLVIDAVDPGDAIKYRRYFLPKATATMAALEQILLEMGKDNTSPNIMKVTFDLSKPDAYSTDPVWYWIDTINV